jgi:N-acyl-D-amino-acid deacylase
VADAADFEAPTRPARGIHTVIVNGTTAWADGGATGARTGQLLTRN